MYALLERRATEFRESSLREMQNVIGALIIRIGVFGAHYTIIVIRNPQNSIGNYLGP